MGLIPLFILHGSTFLSRIKRQGNGIKSRVGVNNYRITLEKKGTAQPTIRDGVSCPEVNAGNLKWPCKAAFLFLYTYYFSKYFTRLSDRKM